MKWRKVELVPRDPTDRDYKTTNQRKIKDFSEINKHQVMKGKDYQRKDKKSNQKRVQDYDSKSETK